MDAGDFGDLPKLGGQRGFSVGGDWMVGVGCDEWRCVGRWSGHSWGWQRVWVFGKIESGMDGGFGRIDEGSVIWGLGKICLGLLEIEEWWREGSGWGFGSGMAAVGIGFGY